MHSYAAWIRYKWQEEYYFEYHNMASSFLIMPISATGDTLHFSPGATSTNYYKEKCCRQYVWKGPNYKEFPECKYLLLVCVIIRFFSDYEEMK